MTVRRLFTRCLVSSAVAAIGCGIVAGCSYFSKTESTPATTEEEKKITVTGTISDWGGTTSPYKGYQFVLYSIDSTRIYRGAVGDGGRVSIESVPDKQKYYAIMLDSDLKFGAILQFPATNDKGESRNYQVFSFGSSGSLGSLFPEKNIIRSSTPENLSAQKDYITRDENKNGIPDGFDADLANNENDGGQNITGDLDKDKLLDTTDPDLDNDGIPNVLDSDIDNNGKADLYDTDLNHDSVDDQQKPFVSYANTSVGFRSVFHEVVTNDDDTDTTSLWFVIETKNAKAKEVSVTSGAFLNGATYAGTSDAFEGKLYDDGTHGDGLAGDGIWSGYVQLAAGKSFTSNHAAIFKLTLSDGTTQEFLYKFTTKLSGSLSVSSCNYDSESGDVKADWTAAESISAQTGLSFQLLISDSTGKRVYTSQRLPVTTTSQTVSSSLFTVDETYSCVVRVLAPSPLSGYPGSTKRTKAVTFTGK